MESWRTKQGASGGSVISIPRIQARALALVLALYVGQGGMSALALQQTNEQQDQPQGARGFDTTPGGGTQLFTTITVPATLICWTEINYPGAWLQTSETIFSPSSRLMATGGGAGWNSVYHETTEPLDEWSHPGTWSCPASWTAYTGFPGSPIGGNSQTVFATVVNPNCNCRGGYNNALRNQRTGPIGLHTFDPNMTAWLWDSFDFGREYWNRTLQDAGSPVRVDSGYGIAVYITPIQTAGVAAQYVPPGAGTERIEVDPEFFSHGWDPLVWDHLVTHEVGHYLGFAHGSCDQLKTVMYTPVNVPNPGAPTQTSNYIGRFSATVPNDRCYVYGEYRP